MLRGKLFFCWFGNWNSRTLSCGKSNSHTNQYKRISLRSMNLPSPSPRFGPPRRAIGETGETGLFFKEGEKEVSPFEKGGLDGSIYSPS